MTENNLAYPVLLTPQEEGGYVATFRDIPEAIAQGNTKEEALLDAYFAFDTAMEFYVENGKLIPTPTEATSDEVLLNLSKVGQYFIHTHNRVMTEKSKKFKHGDFVCKSKGSNWHGRVVGEYSTALTPEGYAVECAFEPGSVQIYPASALEAWDGRVMIGTSEYRVE